MASSSLSPAQPVRRLAWLLPALFAVLAIVALVASGLPADAAPRAKKPPKPGPTVSPSPTPAPTPSPTPSPSATAVPGARLLGVSVPGAPRDLTAVSSFEAQAGHRANAVMWFSGWPYEGFDTAAVAAVAARGSLPVITWEPWDYRAGLDQPTYRLSAIAAGRHDVYLRAWARAAAAYGGPVVLRFAHEMNGTWYPWAEGANGNRPGDYVRAWRHVHDLFRGEAAVNVQWMWAPNVVSQGTTPLAGLYPGNAYVDWVGVDGYNGGTALPWGGWLTPTQVFGPTLAQVAVLAPGKPVLISEVASTEAGGDKAAWIADLFAFVAAQPAVRGLTWFNWNKETDWRITSSESARAAFAAGARTLH